MGEPADIWFVEERRGGKWAPATYHGEKPTGKRTDAANRVFRREPVKVAEGHRNLSLRALQMRYSPDGPFAAMNGVSRETEGTDV